MCNCSCTCNGLFNALSRDMEEERVYRTTREEFIKNNVPIIIQLVNEYNKASQIVPERARESEDKQKLLEILAMKISRYTM